VLEIFISFLCLFFRITYTKMDVRFILGCLLVGIAMTNAKTLHGKINTFISLFLVTLT
jgi:hypothetical protein